MHEAKSESTPTAAPRVGDEIDVTVDALEPHGPARARVGARILAVHGGVPGDRLRVRVFKKVRKTLHAEVVAVLEKSPLRVEPRCRYFGECGGCRRQDLAYSAQLDLKRQLVEDAFTRHGVYPHGGVPAVLPSPSQFYYRNKMEFSFGARRWLTAAEIASGEPFDRDFALGLHRPLHFDRVVDLHECHLQSRESERIVNTVRALAKEQGWKPWSTRTHEGYLRHLGIRQSTRTGDLLVNLVTSSHEPARLELVARRLREAVPAVRSLLNTIHSGLAQVSTGERVEVVFGPGTWTERIGRCDFEVAPHSFFQTHTAQAERLYDLALELAAPRQDDVVFDLFTGVGTIALHFAPHVRRVVGIELDAAAVERARANARRNGIGNVTFVADDAGALLAPDRQREHGPPSLLVLDPPRAGCHPKLVRRLAETGPPRVVYVSCNPVTQAKDVAELAPAYALVRLQPIDLFPHTDHVETVALLERRATTPF